MKGMTVDEMDRLGQAAANGDKAAIQRIDKYWRDQWRDHPDTAAELDWPKSFADEVEKMKKKMAELKAIDDDPVNRMIAARIRQSEVRNDPVLGTILEWDAREVRRSVSKRMGQTIALPPQSAAQERQKQKDKRERQAKVKAMWDANEKDIPQMAETLWVSVSTIKRDLAELKLSKKRR